jgi:hypothetical protein
MDVNISGHPVVYVLENYVMKEVDIDTELSTTDQTTRRHTPEHRILIFAAVCVLALNRNPIN